MFLLLHYSIGVNDNSTDDSMFECKSFQSTCNNSLQADKRGCSGIISVQRNARRTLLWSQYDWQGKLEDVSSRDPSSGFMHQHEAIQ